MSELKIGIRRIAFPVAISALLLASAAEIGHIAAPRKYGVATGQIVGTGGTSAEDSKRYEVSFENNPFPTRDGCMLVGCVASYGKKYQAWLGKEP